MTINDDWTSFSNVFGLERHVKFFNILHHRRLLEVASLFTFKKKEDERTIFRMYMLTYGAQE